jgi:8-oxo-dGTP pyrophosphatase MutT (NUDIX family)
VWGENNVKLFLMRKIFNSNFWEDLGGKTDKKDSGYEDTAIREAVEECNSSLFSEERGEIERREERRVSGKNISRENAVSARRVQMMMKG